MGASSSTGCTLSRVQSPITQLFFDAECVENLVLEYTDCPVDNLEEFMGAFVAENQMHLLIVNIMIIFLLFAAAQIGGVPKPNAAVPTLAYVIWITMTITQWVVGVLSFAMACLTYVTMKKEYGTCLQPWQRDVPDGLRLIDVVGLLTFMFQPVFISKFVLLFMQPLAIFAGIRGVERVVDKSSAFIRKPSRALHAATSGYLACMTVLLSMAYLVSLGVWVATLSFAFGLVYLPMLFITMATTLVIIALVNSLRGISSGLSEAASDFTLGQRRSSVAGSAAAGGGSGSFNKGHNVTSMDVANASAPPPSRRESLGGAGSMPPDARPRTNLCVWGLGYFHWIMVFNFYWCEWAEIKRVEEILQLREWAWWLTSSVVVGVLTLNRILATFISVIIGVLVDIVEKLAQLVSGRSSNRGSSERASMRDTTLFRLLLEPWPCYDATLSYFKSTPAMRQPSPAGGGYRGGAQGGTAHHLEAATSTVGTRASPASSPHLVAIINHVFAVAFIFFICVQMLSPIIVYSELTAFFLYGQRPPLEVSDAFTDNVYDYAFEGFRAFDVPAISAELFRYMNVEELRRVLSELDRVSTQEVLGSSRGLAAIAVLLGVLKPIMYALMSLHGICVNLTLRYSNYLDIVPLGITAKMAATIDPHTFDKATCNLKGRYFTTHELEAIAENQLKDNHTIKVIDLTDTAVKDEGARALADVLPTMHELTALHLGRQYKLTEAGSEELGRALAEMHWFESLTVNSFDFSFTEWKEGGEVDSRRFDEMMAVLLAEVIRSKRAQPQTIRLNNSSIGDVGAVSLGEVLADLAALDTLELRSCGFGAVGGAALGQGLTKLSGLVHLDLSYNLQRAGSREVVGALAHHRGLKAVTLAGCGVDPTSASLLPVMPHLTALDLSDNRIANSGCLRICANLVSMPRLATLHLAHNSVGDDSLEQLVNTLAPLPALANLDLSHNDGGILMTTALALALPSMRALRRLSAGQRTLVDDSAHVLADALEWMSAHPPMCEPAAKTSFADLGLFGSPVATKATLTDLDLYPNHFTRKGVAHMATALRINSTLSRARVSGGWLMIQELRTARDLDFGTQRWSKHDALILAELIKVNSHLKTLKVGFQSDESSKMVADTWKKHKYAHINGLSIR